jgi:O-methyltransferase involved in polyketide biosynthesis
MDLSQVSRTGILLSICRAVLAERERLEFDDPMAVLWLERLLSLASEEDRRWLLHHKRLYEGVHRRDARAGVRRGRVFDRIADRFIGDHPGCTLVNLACGLDTRFWRIKHEQCRFIELDLPEVIELKQSLLKDQLGYELIGKSVLDTSWIDQVTKQANTDFLLIAEGLIMWLPPMQAARLFKEIGARFDRSQLVLDMVYERYTRGIWKQLVRLHSRMDWGLDVSWDFGFKHPCDIEAYADGLKVIGEEKGSAGPILTVSINPPQQNKGLTSSGQTLA